MRILYLNHNVVGSGTYQRAANFAREMAHRGHQVTLVTTSRSARLAGRRRSRDGVAIYEAPDLLWGAARNGMDVWNTLRRIFFVSNARFDLIHAFDCRPTVIVPALAARRRTGAALFTDWADWWGRGGTIRERSGWLAQRLLGPVETWFEEAFRGHALGTTVISSALLGRAMHLGLLPDSVLKLPNGCDPVTISPLPRELARSRLSLPLEPLLLAQLGNLLPADARLLREALRRARTRIPDLRLAWIGEPAARVANELTSFDGLIQTGFVSRGEMNLWLAAADLCVIPMLDTVANRGRWPGKINEYFSAGRPTIMTAVGDAALWLTEADAGWATAPTAEALGGGIVEALADGDRLARAGKRAREIAENRLSWREIGGRLEDFYLRRCQARDAA